MNSQPLPGIITEESKLPLPFKAIIFDMDGTLLESTEADYKAWERTFADYSKQLIYKDYLPMLGIRSADVIRNYLGFKDENDIARILIEKYNHFADYVQEYPIKPVPSANILLNDLTRYDVRLGLATSSRQQKTMMLLEQLDFLKFFSAIVTGEQVKNSKPAPDIFLKAAEKLNVAPHDCVVFEDAPLGVSAAKNAGMKCIAITATHTADKLREADLVIDKYEGADIAELLKRLY